MADDLDAHYERAGQYWGVDPDILRAVHQVEDPSGDPAARSRAGAVGHMQIMPATAHAIGIDPHDPVQSIYGGARVLRENMDRYGNLPDALRAYNGGTDRSKWGNDETMTYPHKVADRYAALKAPGDDPFAGPGTEARPSTSGPQPAPNRDAFSSMFGADHDASSSQAAKESAFDSVFGHEMSSSIPQAAHAHQGTWYGNMVQFARDVDHAARNQFLRTGVEAIDDIPGVHGFLKGTALDLSARHAGLDREDQATASRDATGATANEAGRFLSNALMAGAATELGMGAIGAGGGALARAAGGPAGRAIQAGTNALTGAGGRLTHATSGAAQGYAVNALAGGDPVTGAALGGALGVGLPLAARGVQAIADKASKAGARIINHLAPDEIPAATGEGVAARGPTDGTVPSDAVGPSGDMPNSGASPSGPPPEAIKLGIFSSPKDAEKLADTIWNHYQQGGPVALVRSKIPGVQLTASQASGNPGLALAERNRRANNPNPFTALDQQNTEARNAFARDVIGTEDQLQAAEAARSAAEAGNREQAFGNQQPVDVTAVRQHLARLIDDNKGRETVQAPLIRVLKQVNAVAGEDGTAMPDRLWNVRKYLGDIVSPAARGTDQSGHAAAAQLLELKPTIVDTIEKGAPGFKNYSALYEQMSRPIDAMRFLQSRNLT
ncbi:lytic transglycosylase domain-containing protein, partial [Gluconacetobacter aggeris]|nr:lytic transglycosylase domain-containing protein [Gluconacetobacter aggeris]